MPAKTGVSISGPNSSLSLEAPANRGTADHPTDTASSPSPRTISTTTVQPGLTIGVCSATVVAICSGSPGCGQGSGADSHVRPNIALASLSYRETLARHVGAPSSSDGSDADVDTISSAYGSEAGASTLPSGAPSTLRSRAAASHASASAEGASMVYFVA